jgi:Arc/MetJ-type ribon-helix-helix transcriptional regulator
MNAPLSVNQQQFLEAAVASGVYPSVADALDEAVTLLRRRDDLTAKLNQAAAELDAGKGMPAEDVFRRLEEKARVLDEQAARKS